MLDETNRDLNPEQAFLTLLDWRRKVNHLYARVRSLLPVDPVAAHTVWRAGRDELFTHHPQTPLAQEARPGFQGLPCWQYDPAFAFTAAIQPVEEQRFEVFTSAGVPMPLVRFGQVTLPIGSLDVFWIDVYGGGVFIPFRDATSGRGTYGGGRYLLDTVKSADLGSAPAGEIVLDFNFAYHPSCFYNDAWSCPLAPPSNVLKAEIRAGERAFPLDS